MSSSAAHGFSTLFADRAVHAGLKHAIAGLLAFYWALCLELPSPSWAVLTVMMLMIADYVGAIAEKAALRAAGTIAGAIIGVWLAGDYINNPAFLLPVCFSAMAFGVAMFGGTWFPYAFFLGAVTISVVIVDAIPDPSQAWQIGLNRILEICLGIAASVLISVLIWPRLARVDFRLELSHAILAAGKLVVGSGTAGACDAQSDAERERIQQTFMLHLNKLRNLLHFGARESRYFARRVNSYQDLTLELSALFESAIGIGRDRCFRDSYGPLIGPPLEELHGALAEEFDALSKISPEIAATNSRLPKAIEACDGKIRELVEHEALRAIDFQEVLAFCVYYSSVLEISRRLVAIRSILHGLPALEQPRETQPARFKLTQADLRNGCKTGLSVTIALILVEWLQPPGAAAIPPAAFLFTTLPKLNPSGGGDVGAFARVLKVGLVALLLIPILLFVSPYLSSPMWMAVYTIVGLFVFGVWSSRIGGMSGWSIVYLLFFCGVIGLNAQEPVQFESIFDMAAGTTLGIGVASFVQRFVWPILPQVEITKTFADYYAMCDRMLTTEDPAELRASEAAIAMFVAATMEKLRGARGILRREDSARLVELAGLSQRLGFNLMRCRMHRDFTRPGMPGEFAAPLTAECHAEFQIQLRALAEYFRFARALEETPSSTPAAKALEEAMAEWRRGYLDRRIMLTPEHIQLIATGQANSVAASLLDELASKAAAFPLSRYSGDYYL